MPVVKSINLKQLSEEINAYTDRSIEEIKIATVKGVYRSLPMMVRRSPVDTGQYASSWDMVVTDLVVTLGNFSPHAPIIEFGARPFKPPLTPLLAWAKRVLGDPSQPDSEKGYSSEVWALALYTQKKIEKEGIEPRHVLTKAMPDIIESIRQEYKNLV